MANGSERTPTGVITDFLSSTPTLQAIAEYRLPDDLQEQAHRLLRKNSPGELSEEEHDAMEKFRQVGHLVTMMKVKARARLPHVEH